VSHRLHCLLIEINYYGERLIGCIECNRWGSAYGALVLSSGVCVLG